jgi:hypothetical protein
MICLVLKLMLSFGLKFKKKKKKKIKKNLVDLTGPLPNSGKIPTHCFKVY